MCQEALDRDHQTEGDTKEALYFGREISPDSEEASLPQHGPNQWPSEVGSPALKFRRNLAWHLLRCHAGPHREHGYSTSHRRQPHHTAVHGHSCSQVCCKLGTASPATASARSSPAEYYHVAFRSCCQTTGDSPWSTSALSLRWACACLGSWRWPWACRPSTSTPHSPGPCWRSGRCTMQRAGHTLTRSEAPKLPLRLQPLPKAAALCCPRVTPLSQTAPSCMQPAQTGSTQLWHHDLLHCHQRSMFSSGCACTRVSQESAQCRASSARGRTLTMAC